MTKWVCVPNVVTTTGATLIIHLDELVLDALLDCLFNGITNGFDEIALRPNLSPLKD